jgi:hypothetical protein
MDRELLRAIVVAGDWGVLAIGALWGPVPESNCALWVILCSKFHFKMRLQMDFDNEEEFEGGSDDILADEYQAAVDQDVFQFGFGDSRPGQKDKDGNPIITIVDRSGVHEIGIRWCCCLNAPERDMQLMITGLFPATFRNPRTAFTFRVLEEFHLDNLECKTTPSQFFSRLKRMTSDEFPNSVPVSQTCLSASGRLTRGYRTDIESY